MPDINSYALNLAFNVTSNAGEVFGTIQAQLSTIEEQIQSASTAASQAFNFTGAARTTTAMNSNLARSTTHLRGSANQADMLREDFEDMQQINNVLTSQYEEQNSLIESMTSKTQMLDKYTVGWMGTITGITFGLFDWMEALQEIVSEQEEFSRVSRRVYGDQDEMIKQMSRMTFEYQVFGREAKEAFVSVADQIRFTDSMLVSVIDSQEQFNQIMQDQEYRSKLATTALKRYSEQAAQMSRVTGAAVETVVDWQKAVAAIGFNFSDTERVMNGMVAAMESAGLTAEEITAVLNRQSKMAGSLNLVFGKEGTEAIMQFDTQMQAMFKHLNLPPDAASGAIEGMFSNMQSMIILESEGVQEALRKGLDPEKMGSVDKIQLGFDRMMSQLQEAIETGDVAQRKIVEQRLTQLLGVSPEDFGHVYKAWKEIGSFQKDAINKFLVDQGLDATMSLDKAYADSRDTLGARVEELGDKLMSGWKLLIVQVTPYIEQLIDWLMPLGDVLGDVAMWIDDFNRQAQNLTFGEYWGELFRTIGLNIMDAGDETNRILPMIGKLFIWMGDTAQYVIEQAPVWWGIFTDAMAVAWDYAQWFFNMLADAWDQAAWWVNFFLSIWDQFVAAWNITIQEVGDWATWVGEKIVSGWQTAVDAFEWLLGYLGPLKSFFNIIGNAAKAFFNTVANAIKKAWGLLKKAWNTITGGTQDVVRQATVDANVAMRDAQSKMAKHNRDTVSAVREQSNKIYSDAAERASKIDGKQLQQAAELKRKAMEEEFRKNNPLKKAMEEANPQKAATETAQIISKSQLDQSRQTMSMADRFKAELRAIRAMEGQGLGGGSPRRTAQPVQPQARQQPVRAESVRAAATVHEDKMSQRRSDRDRNNALQQSASESKRAADMLEKDVGMKELMQRMVELLEKQEQTGTGMSGTIGGSHVTEWTR